MCAQLYSAFEHSARSRRSRTTLSRHRAILTNGKGKEAEGRSLIRMRLPKRWGLIGVRFIVISVKQESSSAVPSMRTANCSRATEAPTSNAAPAIGSDGWRILLHQVTLLRRNQMNREFEQYRFARIEGRNVTRARLQSQFKDGINDLDELEKAIALELDRKST